MKKIIFLAIFLVSNTVAFAQECYSCYIGMSDSVIVSKIHNFYWDEIEGCRLLLFENEYEDNVFIVFTKKNECKAVLVVKNIESHIPNYYWFKRYLDLHRTVDVEKYECETCAELDYDEDETFIKYGECYNKITYKKELIEAMKK